MEGRYVYCVANGCEEISFGRIGIDENEVYTIPFKDVCAVVHDCLAKPCSSEDEEVVKDWVITHQSVVDTAWEKCGTVIPVVFDTIIEGKVNYTKNWLKQDYENLEKRIDKVRDRAEYGVQVFWDTSFIAQKITYTNSEIKSLKEEIETKTDSTAYMYRQKQEKLLRREMEIKANQYLMDMYNRIKRHVEESYIEETKKTNSKNQMIMNLSCLIFKNRHMKLGEELEKINNMDGFSVRFTGPWPPYSFVNLFNS